MLKDPVTVNGEIQVSGVTANTFEEWVAVPYVVTAEDGTKQSYNVLINVVNASDDRDFLTFSIIGQISSEITVDGMGVPTIYVLMPSGSSLEGLLAEFSTNSLAENAVHVGGVWQVSGVTENNYNEGIATAYWVVSQSELTKLYNVIVSIEEAPIVTYKVTYTNDATGGWEEDHEEGSLIELPAPMYPDVTWTFLGWQDLATSIVYQTGDTMTVSGDITFYALWEDPAPEPEFAIGDIGPGGGFIFYVDEANAYDWDYLEVAASVTEVPMVYWSSVADVFIGATSTALGTGLENTNLIIAQHGEGGTSAAKSCASLMYGADDWFLPSKEELNLMYVNLQTQGIGGFNPPFYWSSSEYDANSAWYQNFDTNNPHDGSAPKGSTDNFRVRCIRKGNF